MLRIARRLQTGLGLTLLLWGIVGATAADSPSEGPFRLVHDFFPGEFEEVRTPPQLTKLGNALFFVAEDLDLGQSVWRTDGAPGGTGRVPVSGAEEGNAAPRILGPLGPRMLWMTNAAGAPKTWLLVSAGRHGDGTVLAAFTPRSDEYSYVEEPVKVGQRFFFEDCTDRECTFLSTDGTLAGTGPVRVLAAQFTKTDQQILGAFADRWLVFRSRKSLYAYDTLRDRVLLLLPTVPAGARGLYRSRMYPVGDSLFLLILHGPYRSGLWVSRLSAPRASQIFESEGLDVSGWRDDRLYFLENSGQLWSTDGRPGGTRRYSPGRPEPYTSYADRLGTLGPITFFPIPGYSSGGLYAADENRREVREIYHLCSGKWWCLSTSISSVRTVGNRALLEIDGDLWQSDGTPEGTKPNEVCGKTDPGTFRILGGRLVLSATSREGEQQIWETDGTAAGTRALSDPAGGPLYGQGPPIPFAGALYTSAVRKPVGQQIWRLADGRATPITDLRHLASGVEPHEAVPVGDRVLLNGNRTREWLSVAEDGSIEEIPGLYFSDCSEYFCSYPKIPLGRRLLFQNVRDLWATDGTTAGTAAVPLERDGENQDVAAMGAWGDRALIVDGKGGLWTSDGSSAQFFAQLQNPDLLYWDWEEQPVGPPLALGPLAFLFRVVPVDDGLVVEELWRTDGTAAGTLRLASSDPFDEDLTPHPQPAIVGGRLFFRFRGVLWVSDGSAGGTKPLANQLPGGTFALAAGTTTLYAAAGAPGDPQTLWALDPQTLQATRLATYGWVAGGYPDQPLGNVLGNTLLFRATDENEVTRWWVTEGTPQSTREVPEPLASLETDKVFTAGHRHWFTACDSEHGCELWSTDRRGEDTRIVQDLWPGPRTSSPKILAVTEDALWLAATEPDVGRELWKIDLPQGNP